MSTKKETTKAPPKPKPITVTRAFVVTIKGVDIQLTREEAEKLYDELGTAI